MVRENLVKKAIRSAGDGTLMSAHVKSRGRLPFLMRLFTPVRCGGCCPCCIVPEWHVLTCSQHADDLHQIVAQLPKSELYAPHDQGNASASMTRPSPEVAGKLSMNTFNCGTKRVITPSTRVAKSRAMLTGAASCMAITHALLGKVRVTGSTAPGALKPANGILRKVSAIAMMNRWWAELEQHEHG